MPWTVYTDEELWQANVKLAKFRKWADKNPAILRHMWRTTNTYAQTGKHTSAKRLFESARYDDGLRIVDVDSDIKLSNDYSALVARILVRSVPGAKSVFKLKRSVFDLLDDDQFPRFDSRGSLVWGDAA